MHVHTLETHSSDEGREVGFVGFLIVTGAAVEGLGLVAAVASADPLSPDGFLSVAAWLVGPREDLASSNFFLSSLSRGDLSSASKRAWISDVVNQQSTNGGLEVLLSTSTRSSAIFRFDSIFSWMRRPRSVSAPVTRMLRPSRNSSMPSL